MLRCAPAQARYPTMAVRDIYSHRKRIAEGDFPDVFVYHRLPGALRVQIVQICRDAIGPVCRPSGPASSVSPHNTEAWTLIHDLVAREHGVFELAARLPTAASPRRSGGEIDPRCESLLLHHHSVEEVLDLVEVSFDFIDKNLRRLSAHERKRRGITVTATAAIDELNERFKRSGVGYAFEDGKIFRVDSELIHAEVVKPALRYLHQPGFAGAREEFLNAHAHYRAGENKEAITDANNAFESTLKCICDRRGWEYLSGARASDLLRVVRAHGLLPDYLDSSFDQLAATLKSGLPKVRSEEGAHGQGATPRETPDHVAAYALHLAAAKILFLVETHLATPEGP